jgi:hypothetical protein
MMMMMMGHKMFRTVWFSRILSDTVHRRRHTDASHG